MGIPQHFTFERERFWHSVLKVEQSCSWAKIRVRNVLESLPLRKGGKISLFTF